MRSIKILGVVICSYLSVSGRDGRLSLFPLRWAFTHCASFVRAAYRLNALFTGSLRCQTYLQAASALCGFTAASDRHRLEAVIRHGIRSDCTKLWSCIKFMTETMSWFSSYLVYFYYFYYMRWRMPPFMRQCWGLILSSQTDRNSNVRQRPHNRALAVKSSRLTLLSECFLKTFTNFSVFIVIPILLCTYITVYCRNYCKLERCITDMDYWMSANRLKLNMDKTELMWAGTRYNMSMLNDSGPSLQLNNVTVNASQHVRVLGVHFASDLSLEKHVSSVSAICFYHLQIGRASCRERV